MRHTQAHATGQAALATTATADTAAATAPASGAPIRLALYSHDAQGLGHLRRNLSLAHYLARLLPGLTGRRVTGLVVTGLAPGDGLVLPGGFDWLVLPGVTKTARGYQPRHLAVTRSHLGQVRSRLLGAALTAFAPDLLVIDRHPYGVRHELHEPLRALRRTHPCTRVVLGLREVLDTPEAVVREWDSLGPASRLRELFDEVWVYGDPTVHDITTTGESPGVLDDRVRFTGYLARGRRAVDSRGEPMPRPFVLTTVGGGSDGSALLQAAVSMAPPPGHDHVIVTGPQASDEELAVLRRSAGPRTRVLRCLPGMSRHIAEAAAVISMGGYNTVCEILASSTPALVVPREAPREEQVIRARALTQAEALEHLRLSELDARTLSSWAAEAVGRRQLRRHVDLGGLFAVPRLAAELLASAHTQDDSPGSRSGASLPVPEGACA